jgi:hypothetical protein
MITDADLNEIKPPKPLKTATAEHTQSGLPLPKPARVRSFSPAECEEFIEGWATSLHDTCPEPPPDLAVQAAGCTCFDYGKSWTLSRKLAHSIRSRCSPEPLR